MNDLEKELLNLVLSEKYKVNIRKCGSFYFCSEYRYEVHAHPEIEINYITAGGCIMEVNDRVISLKKGDCIIINPMQKHCFRVDIGMNCRLMQLEHRIQLPDLSLKHIECLIYDVDFYIINGCEELYVAIDTVNTLQMRNESSIYQQSQLDLALLNLYVILSQRKRSLNTYNDIGQGVFGKVLAEINKNFENKISIEALAEQFSISSRYIRKEFQKRLGLSASEYIMLLRINKARDLLWKTKKSITDISFSTGFGSSQYFCRVFKKMVGKTPYEYRNEWSTEQLDTPDR